MAKPIRYFAAGKFSSPAGWTHKLMRHGNDFEVIIGLHGRFRLRVSCPDSGSCSNDGETPAAGRPISGTTASGDEAFGGVVAGEPAAGDGVPAGESARHEGFAEREFVVSPHLCVAIPPHSVVCGVGKTDEPVEFLWFHFYAQWDERPVRSLKLYAQELQGPLGQLSRREHCSDLAGSCLIPDQYFVHDASAVTLALTQLMACANSYRYSARENDLYTQIALMEITNDFLLSLAGQSDALQKITRVAEWVRSHMSANMSVAPIADHFGMNGDYLARIFKREMGMTLRDFLIDIRVDTAQVLLAHTELPIKQVSKYAYYTDARSFMRQFKQRVGATPSQYRAAFSRMHLNNSILEDRAFPLPHDVTALIEEL